MAAKHFEDLGRILRGVGLVANAAVKERLVSTVFAIL